MLFALLKPDGPWLLVCHLALNVEKTVLTLLSKRFISK